MLADYHRNHGDAAASKILAVALGPDAGKARLCHKPESKHACAMAAAGMAVLDLNKFLSVARTSLDFVMGELDRELVYETKKLHTHLNAIRSAWAKLDSLANRRKNLRRWRPIPAAYDVYARIARVKDLLHDAVIYRMEQFLRLPAQRRSEEAIKEFIGNLVGTLAHFRYAPELLGGADARAAIRSIREDWIADLAGIAKRAACATGEAGENSG